MNSSARDFLRQSLPLARQWAKELCRHIDDSGVSCAAFHEIWQILRYLELNTTPLEHDTFFVSRLTESIRNGARRVLITGTADYAMLDVVHRAFAAAQVQPDISIVDVCETPLRLCQWYADLISIPITVHCSDILTYADKLPYDLICTHSFLGLFDHKHRQLLAAKWYSLLAPDGLVLSVNRVRPNAPERVSFTAEEAATFEDHVSKRLAANRDGIDLNPLEIAELAGRYIRHRVVYPLRGASEIMQLLSTAGFHLDFLSPEVSAVAEAAPLSGPTLRGGAYYACFVARRPR